MILILIKQLIEEIRLPHVKIDPVLLVENMIRKQKPGGVWELNPICLKIVGDIVITAKGI